MTLRMNYLVGLIVALVLSCGSLWAQQQQRTALVDMEFIMSKIPAYQSVGKQLDALSKQWQGELSKLEREAETLYKRYRSELVGLSAEQKSAREEAIIAKEKEAHDLKRKYFGPEGELVKRREALMKPVQDEVWKVLKEIALKDGYQLIIDRSTGKIVYADPVADISREVLERMGVTK